jgi:uncharacterized protein (TIGR00725 family)
MSDSGWTPVVGPPAGYAAIVGPGDGASQVDLDGAFQVGAGLAAHDVVIVTGGLGGVMGAAAAGARSVGGTSLGLLPGDDRSQGAPEHTVTVPTGLGELRNGLVVRAGDVVVSVGGSWGTLSEIALALRAGKPLVRLQGWPLPGPGPHGVEVSTPDDAVAAALDALGRADV